MKTSELTGAALDWAVAECEGRDFPSADAFCGIFNPSTDWAQGGPIIEREQLNIGYSPEVADDPLEPWLSDDYAGKVCSGMYWGATPLIAAMRCYVASKLGDEVEIPEELK